MKLRASKPKKKSVYICGPMRGYPQNNFPAFDKARDLGLSLGFEVISPADMDRNDDPKEFEGLDKNEIQAIYAARDLQAVMDCTHIAILPGWEKSVGAKPEYFTAAWLGKEILDAETFEPYGEIGVEIKKKDVEYV